MDRKLRVTLPSSDSTDGIFLEIHAFYRNDLNSPIHAEKLDSIWAHWHTPSLHGVYGPGIWLGDEEAKASDLFHLSDEENNRNITLLEETLTAAEQAAVLTV